eukprot:SAG31_NODE_15838_length_736_cov_0.684458_1_plen_99_part_00
MRDDLSARAPGLLLIHSYGLTLDGMRFTKAEVDRRRGAEIAVGYAAVPDANSNNIGSAGDGSDNEGTGDTINAARGGNEPATASLAAKDSDSGSDIVE